MSNNFFNIAKENEPDDLAEIPYEIDIIGWMRNVSFGKLSGGLKRRLTLAASLIHGPSVLFLDEPTTGLDVMRARALRGIIQSLKNKGIATLLTTHSNEESDLDHRPEIFRSVESLTILLLFALVFLGLSVWILKGRVS
ncbi:MAG: AAA family ATPase [Planctomycetia bacterium]|nr:AAA family ATPase [Planctomycetia bacterium]